MSVCVRVCMLHVGTLSHEAPGLVQCSATISLKFLILLRPVALGPANCGTGPGVRVCVCTRGRQRPRVPRSPSPPRWAHVRGPCGWGLRKVDVRGKDPGMCCRGLEATREPCGKAEVQIPRPAWGSGVAGSVRPCPHHAHQGSRTFALGLGH